jgi:TRAP-type C4-dicarboxylate transport system permease small subunit
MRAIDRVLVAVGSAVPAALLGVVLIVVTANIVARTILGMSFHTAHDLALIAFAGVVWFGLVGAAVDGQMFGVNFFVDRLPQGPQRFARLLVRAIVIVIALSVIYAAWAQIETARFTRFLALGWPKWIVSAGLLVSMLLLVIVQIREAVDLMRVGASEERG